MDAFCPVLGEDLVQCFPKWAWGVECHPTGVGNPGLHSWVKQVLSHRNYHLRYAPMCIEDRRGETDMALKSVRPQNSLEHVCESGAPQGANVPFGDTV